jgi:hypothetical protein
MGEEESEEFQKGLDYLYERVERRFSSWPFRVYRAGGRGTSGLYWRVCGFWAGPKIKTRPDRCFSANSADPSAWFLSSFSASPKLQTLCINHHTRTDQVFLFQMHPYSKKRAAWLKMTNSRHNNHHHMLS